MSNQPTSNPSQGQQGGGSPGTSRDDPQRTKDPSDKGRQSGSPQNDQNRKGESGRSSSNTGGGSSTQR